jgi:hypothetical protein
MKLSTIVGRLLPVLILLLATSAFAANKGSLVVLDAPVTVSGHQLTPGEYQLKWEGAAPTVELSILSKGKVVATVPAHIVDRPNANPYDSYSTDKNSDGTLSLTQIKFGGKKYVLALGDEAAAKKEGSASGNSN